MDNSLYVVIAANHCWGAAESLTEALSNAHLREQTRLSHFDWVFDQEELEERWDSWLEYGEQEWREEMEFSNEVLRGSTLAKPVECVIYRLDCEIWKSYRICDVSGGLSAEPLDPEMTGKEASKKLAEIQIRALFANGVLKPSK